MSRRFYVFLESEDWIEISTSLETKIKRIRVGDFGPEEKPGEDAQWIAHLQAINKAIEEKLYSRKKEGE